MATCLEDTIGEKVKQTEAKKWLAWVQSLWQVEYKLLVVRREVAAISANEFRSLKEFVVEFD